MGLVAGLFIIGFSAWAVFAFVRHQQTRASFFASLRQKPIPTMAVIGMCAGINVFMYAIFVGHPSISVSHVTVFSVPLGFAGFLFAGLCLVVLMNCRDAW